MQAHHSRNSNDRFAPVGGAQPPHTVAPPDRGRDGHLSCFEHPAVNQTSIKGRELVIPAQAGTTTLFQPPNHVLRQADPAARSPAPIARSRANQRAASASGRFFTCRSSHALVSYSMCRIDSRAR